MAKVTKRLAVDVTPEQHAQFKKDAAALGVSQAALMEHRLFGGPLPTRPVGRPKGTPDGQRVPQYEKLPLPKAS